MPPTLRRWSRSAPFAVLLLVGACQTTTTSTKDASTGPAAPPSRLFGQNKGWMVERIADATGTAPYCQATRQTGAPPSLSFRSAPRGLMVIIGDLPRPLDQGRIYEVTIRFGGAGGHNFRALASDPATLAIGIEGDPDDAAAPFLGPKTMTVGGPHLGATLNVALTGSNWALNALDECRRMLNPPATS